MQCLKVEFTAADPLAVAQGETFNKFSALKLFPNVVNVDMRLFSDPAPGYFTRHFRQDAVDCMCSNDHNGNLRFSKIMMGTAYLLIDDIGKPDLTDDSIMHNLTTATSKQSLPFTAMVIAGRHSTYAAVELIKRGLLDPKEAPRPCFVWRMSQVGKEGAIALGSGENRSKELSTLWDPTFIDQVRYCQCRCLRSLTYNPR
jgi:hypothetical protein